MILRKVAATAALPSILFFLVAGEFAPAQTPSAAKPTPAAQPSANADKTADSPAAAKAEESEKETPAKRGKANEQGIKVHGHWILQVKNADGTLGERREFDNSLVTSGTEVTGSQVMAGLLAGDFAAGDPTVTFVQSPLPPNSDATDYCQNIFCGYLTTIHTSAYVSGSGAATQAGLSAIVQFSPTVNWTLSGTYKIPSGLTSIGAVQVWLDFCLNKKFPAYQHSTLLPFVGSADDRAADVTSQDCTGGTSVPITDIDNETALTSTLVQNAGGTPRL